MSNNPAILGGNPVRTLPFAPRKTMGQAEKDAVMAVLDSDVLSAFIGAPGPFFLGGEKVRKFEENMAEKFGYKHAISINSWTTGLVTAIGAIGIGPGDEVICPPYTMSASATCVLFYGGVPVFADIDPNTFCIDPASIEARITPRTKAIVVVHLFGHPAEMDAIAALAERHALRVIEDAAQSPGALHKGKPVGALVDIGGFSFNYHKHIHTGEGGMLVTNDDTLAQRCQLIRNHGENVADAFSDEQLVNIIGSNYRLTEIQAAIGIEQLKRLDGYLATRQELAAHLGKRLSATPGLTPQTVAPDCTHAYYFFPIKYDSEAIGLSRDLFVRAVMAELPGPQNDEDIPLTQGYVAPLYWSKVYQRRIALGRHGFPFKSETGFAGDYHRGLCPVAERMHEKELLLCPLVREPLTPADLDDLVEAIHKVIDQADLIRETMSEAASASS